MIKLTIVYKQKTTNNSLRMHFGLKHEIAELHACARNYETQYLILSNRGKALLPPYLQGGQSKNPVVPWSC